MHAATLANSSRLQTVLDYLLQCGEAGATTRDIVIGANVCAVNSVIAELRANGIDVTCEYEGTTERGAKVYRYRVAA